MVQVSKPFSLAIMDYWNRLRWTRLAVHHLVFLEEVKSTLKPALRATVEDLQLSDTDVSLSRFGFRLERNKGRGSE